MIRICYEDFSAGTHDGNGLHGRTERGARGVKIYLRPGLSTAERRVALRRLRQEASRGLGPPLPLPLLVLALGLDRVCTAAKIARAIVRLHPAVSLLPSAFVVVLLALLVAASAGARGSLAKTRVGPADAGPARSDKHPRTETMRPQVARMTEVSVVVGVQIRQRSLADLVPRQREGQPARRPAAPWAVPPYTAHLPGPRDFAQ